MTEIQALGRMEALQAAFQTGRPKPQAWYSFLIPTKRPVSGYSAVVAALAIGEAGTPEEVAERVGTAYDALSAATRRGYSQIQWVEAALSLHFDIDPAALAARIKHPKLTRDEASALSALNVDTAEPEAVRAIYKAISPWMVNQTRGAGARLAVYTALHLLAGRDPETLKAQQIEAKALFQTHADAKRVSDAGARACLAFDADPRETLQRFTSLWRARNENRDARKLPRDTVMEWAALGLDTTQFVTLRRYIVATSKVKNLSNYGRIQLAWILFSLADGGANTHMEDKKKTSLLITALVMVKVLEASGDSAGGGDGGDGGGGE